MVFVCISAEDCVYGEDVKMRDANWKDMVPSRVESLSSRARRFMLSIT